MSTMPFGKYKGVELSHLPDDYLDWLLSLDDLRPLLAQALQAEAKRRVKAAPTSQLNHYTLMMADEIVSAGRKVLAIRHHPDKGGETKTMQAVNEAAQWLQDAIFEAKKTAKA